MVLNNNRECQDTQLTRVDHLKVRTKEYTNVSPQSTPTSVDFQIGSTYRFYRVSVLTINYNRRPTLELTPTTDATEYTPQTYI